MVRESDVELYRRDARNNGRLLSAKERERIVKPYLPDISIEASSPSKYSKSKQKKRPQHRKRVRPLLKYGLHLLIYNAVQLFFSIYIRIRQTYRALFDRVLGILYYHHRTPELIKRDVKSLSRLPEHLSVILHLRSANEDGIERLMDEVAEITAWCASAGIPMLSVYERTGVLKSIIPNVHSTTKAKLSDYFGPSPHTPTLKITAPHHSNYSPPPSPTTSISSYDSLSGPTSSITLLLLSESDGRDTLVDLTRTLTEMAQRKKISPKDISMELIDAEISETTRSSFMGKGNGNGFGASTGEPDLLIIFGPYVQLDGYPPWQIRLTEIMCTGTGIEPRAVKKRGSHSQQPSAVERPPSFAGTVEYQGFIRALWRFAGAEMRFGR